MPQQLDISELSKSMNKLGHILVEAYKSDLAAQGKVASGSLLTSITHKIEVGENSVDLLIEFNDYGAFVDSGRKAGGKRVPIEALVGWIENKGLADGDTDIVSLAYAIQTNIWKFGIDRTGWFTDTTQRYEPLMQEMIGDGFFQSLDFFFDKIVTEANANQAGRTIA